MTVKMNGPKNRIDRMLMGRVSIKYTGESSKHMLDSNGDIKLKEDLLKEQENSSRSQLVEPE